MTWDAAAFPHPIRVVVLCAWASGAVAFLGFGSFALGETGRGRTDGRSLITGSDAVLDEQAQAATAADCGIMELRPNTSNRSNGITPCTGTGLDATGNHAVLDGNDCSLTVEAFASNTGCYGSNVTTVQAQLGANLIPPAGLSFPAVASCQNDADCVLHGYRTGSQCFLSSCTGAYVRPDIPNSWVAPNYNFDVSTSSQVNYSCGSITFGTVGAEDDGLDHYFATFEFDVNPGVTGLITIDIENPDVDSFFIVLGPMARPPIGKVIDATLEIPTGRCCTEPCVEDVTRAECGDDLRFGPGLSCPESGGPACPLIGVGTCCDRTTGDCSDNVFSLDCVGDEQGFFLDASCADIECIPSAIPAVSEWGFVILTMLLLAAAKVHGHRSQRVS